MKDFENTLTINGFCPKHPNNGQNYYLGVFSYYCYRITIYVENDKTDIWLSKTDIDTGKPVNNLRHFTFETCDTLIVDINEVIRQINVEYKLKFRHLITHK